MPDSKLICCPFCGSPGIVQERRTPVSSGTLLEFAVRCSNYECVFRPIKIGHERDEARYQEVLKRAIEAWNARFESEGKV